ncbi:MAG: PIN domain-containing protein [Gemmatales bacterium]
MNEVFVDSFYYIAMLNPRDQYHSMVMQATPGFPALAYQYVTTIWVLAETANTLSYPSIRPVTKTFLKTIPDDPNTIIIPATQQLFDRGVELFCSRDDKSWSLTDCISIEVMKERGIKTVLSGDHHFTQAGFHSLFDTSI